MARRQYPQHWQTGGATMAVALMAMAALTTPAMAQGAAGKAGSDGQLSAPARAVLQQGAAPASLESLPWVDAPARPRARPPAPAKATATKPTAAKPTLVADQVSPIQQIIDQHQAARPAPAPSAQPAPAPTSTGTPAASAPPISPDAAVTTPPPPAATSAFAPVPEPVQSWTVSDAEALVRVINGIGSEGLFPADYQPDVLQHAIEQGAGPALDEAASRAFDWLAEDLRDGRTPMPARENWFIVDPDQDTLPTAQLLTQALATHDVPGVLAALAPAYPDYAALKAALAATAPGDSAQADAIRANMDRWRWLPRDLGFRYLIANVPEFEVRMLVNGRLIRGYHTIVGKPGRTSTPQLSAKVQQVVFYPTWTVPQSIIEHDHYAEKYAANPNWAVKNNFKVTRQADGSLSFVQQPGTKNSLGEMKIDMPNPHAIYLHDTDARYLFARPARAFSHGCVRVEKAVELGMTIALISKSITQDKAEAIYRTHKNTRVPITTDFPVYIAYFTLGTDEHGQLTRFADLYNHDPAVIASFAAPRALHTTQRTSGSEVIKAEDPL